MREEKAASAVAVSASMREEKAASAVARLLSWLSMSALKDSIA